MNFNPKCFQSKLSLTDFKRLSNFIFDNYGINLTSNKKELLEYRLQKRLQNLQLDSYELYTNYLFSSEGLKKEPQELINVVSTNKTDFFRENQHFTLLSEKILPDLINNYKGKEMPIWSAGCASGEEVYSLAITLENFRSSNSLFNYSILGTDISQTVISQAEKAIYPMEVVHPVDNKDLKKYFLKSTDVQKKMVRVKKILRDKVKFSHLNLMDEFYKTPHIYPIIFCRNTLIYFDRETKRNILKKLHSRLISGGLLFISHTESLVKLDDGFKLIFPSVYKKVDNRP